MSRVFYAEDHIMLMTDYKTPNMHKHLASHMIVSLGGTMKWNIEEKDVECRGICIGSNVRHTGIMPKEGTLVLLFTNVSGLGAMVQRDYLQQRSYQVLSEQLVERMVKVYQKWKEQPVRLDQELLRICHLQRIEKVEYDTRVAEAIQQLEKLPSIEPGIYDQLSNRACLSKSRFSHLFKEQTGMTLHSYIAFLKFEKTFEYIKKGDTITMACMAAGFDSSSHCAATSKRMFGISIREFHKSLKDSV
ncbi:MAG: AraC family transcriptional regulator [bacterium]|nr:AraC family transcriptional regulator [bacterium]